MRSGGRGERGGVSGRGWYGLMVRDEWGGKDVRPLPWIVAWVAAGGEELAHLKACDVGLRVAAVVAQYSGGERRG